MLVEPQVITNQSQAFAIAAMTRRRLDPADQAKMRAVSVPVASISPQLRKLAQNISDHPQLGDSVWGRGPEADAARKKLRSEVSALEVAEYSRSLYGSSPKVKQARAMAQQLLGEVLTLSEIPQ